MNYILQLRAFDDFKLFDTKLSAGQNALWYALMSINNKTNWRTWFTVANSTLENLSGLSRSGIVKDRNILRQLGLIDFQSNGKKATSYRVRVLYTSNSTQDSTQSSVQDGIQSSAHNRVQDSTQSSVQNSSTLTKQNKTKQNDDEEEHTTKFSDDDENWAKIIKKWEDLWGFPNSFVIDALNDWVDSVGYSLIDLAIGIAAKHQVIRSGAFGYVDRIISDWEDHNVVTLDQAKKANQKHENLGRSNSYKHQNVNTIPKTREDWVG